MPAPFQVKIVYVISSRIKNAVYVVRNFNFQLFSVDKLWNSLHTMTVRNAVVSVFACTDFDFVSLLTKMPYFSHSFVWMLDIAFTCAPRRLKRELRLFYVYSMLRSKLLYVANLSFIVCVCGVIENSIMTEQNWTFTAQVQFQFSHSLQRKITSYSLKNETW